MLHRGEEATRPSGSYRIWPPTPKASTVVRRGMQSAPGAMTSRPFDIALPRAVMQRRDPSQLMVGFAPRSRTEFGQLPFLLRGDSFGIRLIVSINFTNSSCPVSAAATARGGRPPCSGLPSQT